MTKSTATTTTAINTQPHTHSKNNHNHHNHQNTPTRITTWATTFALMLSASLGGIAYAKGNADLPVEELRNFVDVYNTIRSRYVDEKEGKELIDYAIRGMLNELDPHSVYLKKSALDDFNEEVDGQYSGFGLYVQFEKGKLVVIAPVTGSPADKAGIRTGDIIFKINETIVDNLSMEDITKLFKGETLNIGIYRRGEIKEFELERSMIEIPSVESRVLDKEYGYIRITEFSQNVVEQFETALNELLAKNVKGLVIDLRNNPGGIMEPTIKLVDMFLSQGLIVSTKNENTGMANKVHATEKTLAKDIPMVVLVDEGSASASELFAGALQSHKRALIVGQRTFGKGSMQEIVPLSNGDAIKLTIGRYYTPNNESIQAKGIEPDIVLSKLRVTKEDDALNYSESYMPKHLVNEEDLEATKEKAQSDSSDDDSADNANATNDNDGADKSKADSDKANDNGNESGNDNGDDNDTSGKTNDGDSDATADSSAESSDDKKASEDDDSSSLGLAKSDLQLFEALNVLKVLIFKQ